MLFNRSIVRSAIFAGVTSALVLTVGCGKKEDEDEDETELEGTWVKACGSDNPQSEEPDYDKSLVNFDEDEFTAEIQSFSDAACATKTSTMNMTGTFTVGDAVEAPAGAKAYTVKTAAVTMTLHDAETVKAYNGETEGSTAICGGNWTIDVAHAMSTELCGAEVFTVSDTYDVFKIDGDKVYFGETGDEGSATDGSTAEKRPTTLETRFSQKQ